MCLRLTADLRGRPARVGQRLVRFLLQIVGVRLGVVDDLLRGAACVRDDLVSLPVGAGDMVLGGPLRQGQYLQRLALRGRIGQPWTRHLRVLGLLARRRSG